MTTAHLARFLKVGVPVSIDAIASAAGCSRREVEQAIEAALTAPTPYPVVADGRGVRVAESWEALDDYQRRLEARIRSQLRRVRGVKRAKAGYLGQGQLWDAA